MDIQSILEIIKEVGPAWTILLITILLGIPIIGTTIASFLQRKQLSKLLDSSHKNFNKIIEQLTERIEIVIEDQTIIMSSIENITEAIVVINSKVQRNISQPNATLIVKKFIEGYFLVEVMEKTMTAMRTLKDNPDQEEVLKNQLKLEIKNIWNFLLSSMDELITPIKLGKLIKNEHENKITKKGGFTDDIVETTFDLDMDTSFKYKKIKSYFYTLSIEISDTVKEGYKKIRNGES